MNTLKDIIKLIAEYEKLVRQYPNNSNYQETLVNLYREKSLLQ